MVALQRSINLINEVCAKFGIELDTENHLQLTPRLLILINNFERGFSQVNFRKLEFGIANFHNYAVVNLTTLVLPPSAIQLLKYGMQFNPYKTPSVYELRNKLRDNINEFVSNVAEKLSILERYRAHKPIRINLNNSDWSLMLYKFHSSFRRKCNWGVNNSRDSLDLEHSNSLESLRFNLELAANLTHFITYSNLSTEEWRVANWLRDLVRRKKIMLTKADKGRQWVVADYRDYVMAMERFINSSGNYRKVPFNSKYKIAAGIKRTVNKFRDLLDERTRMCLLAHVTHPRSRQFYGLLKIHKPKTSWVNNFPPIRPICPDLETETANSAKYVALALKSIMMAGTSFIKSSFDLVEEITRMRDLPTTCCLITVDIDSLYPSIPPLLAFQIIKRAIYRHTPNDTLPKRHTEFVLELLHLQLFENVMEFGGECFEQVTGIPMGRAWAPAVASIFMDYWDDLVMTQLNEPPLLYKRFLDDVFVIAKSETHAQNIISAMRNCMACIKIGSYSVATSVNFLDIKLSLVNNTESPHYHYKLGSCSNVHNEIGLMICTQLYRKPLDLGVVLDFRSSHAYNVKIGVLFGQCSRILRLSSRVDIAGEDIRNLIELMIKLRHCPTSLRRRLHRRVLISLITRSCCFQRIVSTECARTRKFRVNTGQMYVHLRVPVSADIHFLQQAVNNFNNQLPLVEKYRLVSRIVFRNTGNLSRMLIYK
jgi:hypothetical protein